MGEIAGLSKKSREKLARVLRKAGGAMKDLEMLVSFAERLGSGAVFKRLGFLLKRFVPDEKSIIEKCRSRISAGNTKLDPSLPAKRLVTRWRLRVPDNWTREQKRDQPA